MDINQMTILPPRNAFEKMRIAELANHPEVVKEILSEQQEALQHTSQLSLRKLGFGLKSLLWFLRLYVVFMTVVVVINVVHTLP